jgi:hypothetical protein
MQTSWQENQHGSRASGARVRMMALLESAKRTVLYLVHLPRIVDSRFSCEGQQEWCGWGGGGAAALRGNFRPFIYTHTR